MAEERVPFTFDRQQALGFGGVEVSWRRLPAA